MFACATLLLALCGRASSAFFWGREWGIGEGRGGDGGWWGGWEGCVCIHQPTPGLWSMKEARQKTAAARHSDKTLQIVPLIKNLSCRNTIDSKRGRENRQPEPRTPSLLHPPTYTDLPSLSFSPHSGAQIAPKNYAYHTSIWGWAPSVGGRPCVSRIVNGFSLFLCHPPHSVTNLGRHCKWEAACTRAG